ncbi:MAG TPA: M1 family aminopeptidase, partial [Gemmatimonadales bacterium]|nr:M1 family aminopeptidase [Gemmatimonadales bacterium]
AHQWFGNLVTVGNWSDIWLNEGFATYAAALWRENTGGPTAYHAMMDQLDTGDFDGTVFVRDSTDLGHMFTHTTFNKGAWVLHMLRHVVGDSVFFGVLRTWVRNESSRPATTDGFRRAVEAAWGAPLDWFFDEWVYAGGRPAYAASWRQSAPGQLDVTIRQTQPGRTFRMPLDLRVRFPRGDTVFTVQDSLATQSFQLPWQGAPVQVDVDPGNWVLKAPPDSSPVRPGHQNPG